MSQLHKTFDLPMPLRMIPKWGLFRIVGGTTEEGGPFDKFAEKFCSCVYMKMEETEPRSWCEPFMLCHDHLGTRSILDRHNLNNNLMVRDATRATSHSLAAKK